MRDVVREGIVKAVRPLAMEQEFSTIAWNTTKVPARSSWQATNLKLQVAQSYDYATTGK